MKQVYKTLYSLMTGFVSKVQSNLGYPNADYPKLLGYSKTMDSPDFFLYYLLQLNYQLFEFRLSEKFNFSK